MPTTISGASGVDKINYSAVDDQAEWANLKNTNGYTKLPNGLIMQWGYVPASTAVTFPIAFTTACLSVNVQIVLSGSTFDGGHVNPTNITTSGFTRIHQSQPARWFAIGY